jgi:hypothetical protein
MIVLSNISAQFNSTIIITDLPITSYLCYSDYLVPTNLHLTSISTDSIEGEREQEVLILKQQSQQLFV